MANSSQSHQNYFKIHRIHYKHSENQGTTVYDKSSTTVSSQVVGYHGIWIFLGLQGCLCMSKLCCDLDQNTYERHEMYIHPNTHQFEQFLKMTQ